MKILVLAAAILAGAELNGQPVEFLHITDTHVMKIEGIHPALVPLRQTNLLTAPQLEGFFEGLKSKPPDFILHTGDMLEAFRYDGDNGGIVGGQIERFHDIVKRSPVPVYLALGNRDVSWYRQAEGKQVAVRNVAMTTEARAAWRQAYGFFRENTWYSFEKKSGNAAYLFAVLDNGDIADADHVRRQLDWLRALLARPKPSALVLALHIPLGDNPFSRSVRELLSGLGRPVLVLAGHNHTDDVLELSASPRQVQVRTASFAGGKFGSRRIVLKPDGMEVYATGDRSNLLFTIPVTGLAQ